MFGKPAPKPPTSSDAPTQSLSPASNLSGALPFRKRKVSPFDRIGARQWDKSGKSYA